MKPSPSILASLRSWLPTRGNIIFTLLVASLLFGVQAVGALPYRAPAASVTSTAGIPYQGRLADADGAPLTGTYTMVFRLYAIEAGGAPLWEEQWTGSNGVKVSDGLFNVMLGSLNPLPNNVVTGNSNLWLGITVNTDNEMTPRVQLGVVPYTIFALNIADGTVTTAKLVDGAVTNPKLANDAVTGEKIMAGTIGTSDLADGSVTQIKLGDESITTAKIVDGAVTARKIGLGGGIGTAPATSLVLTASPQNISGAGATVNLNSTLALIVIATFEFAVNQGAETVAIGGLHVDGSSVSGQALYGPGVGSPATVYGTATVSQIYRLQLSPGSHTLQLYASKGGNGGAEVKGPNTRLIWFASAN